MTSLLKSNNMTESERPRRLRSPPVLYGTSLPQPPCSGPSAYQQLTNYFSDVVTGVVPIDDLSPEKDEMKRKRIQIVEDQIRSYKKKDLLGVAKSLTKCEAKSCMSKDQVLRAVAESYLDSLDRRRVPIQDDVVVIDITEEAMNDNNNAVTNVASDASCNKYLHYGNKEGGGPSAPATIILEPGAIDMTQEEIVEAGGIVAITASNESHAPTIITKEDTLITTTRGAMAVVNGAGLDFKSLYLNSAQNNGLNPTDDDLDQYIAAGQNMIEFAMNPDNYPQMIKDAEIILETGVHLKEDVFMGLQAPNSNPAENHPWNPLGVKTYATPEKPNHHVPLVKLLDEDEMNQMRLEENVDIEILDLTETVSPRTLNQINNQCEEILYNSNCNLLASFKDLDD